MADNKAPLLSIIVPVYNTAPYIEECVDSVLNQDFADWELILVNDGSTDKSGEICDSQSLRDPRIRAYHKANEGQLRTRLFGIEKALGTYVTGLDSDDVYSKDALSVISAVMATSENENIPDIVAFNIASFEDGDDAHTKHEDIIQYDTEALMSGMDYLKLILGNTDNSFCDKVIKKELFLKRDFSDTPTHLRVSEDYMMIMPVVTGAAFVKTLPNVLYYYRQHSDSANHRVSALRALDEIEAGEYVYDTLLREGFLKADVEKILLSSAIGQFSFRLKEVIKSGELTKDICRKIQGNSFYDKLKAYENPSFVSKDKYMILKLFRLRAVWLINTIYRVRGKN